MSLDTFRRAIDLLADYIDRNNIRRAAILFHGGEPFLWQYENYVVALDYVADVVGNRARIKAQTNATLLTDELIDLFHEHNGYISVSIDGPVEINDQLRVFPDGSGTFDILVDKIMKLRRVQGHVGAILVVTRIHVGNEDKIYQFFKELGIGLQPSPLISAGRAQGSGLDLTADEYYSFMTRLFDIWAADDDPIVIPYFMRIVRAILLRRQINYCRFSEGCAKGRGFITVDYDGSLAMCNRTSSLGDPFRMGNVYQIKRLEDVFDTPLWRILELRADVVREKYCRSCWLYHEGLCRGGGGCLFSAYVSGRFFEPPYNCELERRFVKYVYDIVVQYRDVVKTILSSDNNV